MEEATYSLCPRCYRAVPKSAKERFCVSCGEAMLQQCPHCKSPIHSPYARYCNHCGKSLNHNKAVASGVSGV